MATTTLDSGSDPVLGTARRWRRTPTTLDGAPSAATTTTYYYRLLDGTRSTTTDVGSIPAGAVVERVS